MKMIGIQVGDLIKILESHNPNATVTFSEQELLVHYGQQAFGVCLVRPDTPDNAEDK